MGEGNCHKVVRLFSFNKFGALCHLVVGPHDKAQLWVVSTESKLFRLDGVKHHGDKTQHYYSYKEPCPDGSNPA